MFFPMRCGWVLCQAWLSTAVISGVCLAQAGALDSEPQDTQVVAPDVALRPAEQTAASFRLPPGFHVQAFAEEPMVRQPIAFTFDSRGRLWVVENYTYAEQPANYDLRYRDRIIILEDTDHDGRADRRRVFWAEGQRVTSVAVSWNGVYALCAPYLVFLPDRDQDDIPDGPPQILLDGWNDQAIRHNIVNGLRWGPTAGCTDATGFLPPRGSASQAPAPISACPSTAASGVIIRKKSCLK
ncbi:MAG: hypothetical protein KatS3mg110_2433 [Pirellulaceae bacterium]|nr:MAG: hypothetical protein KatS3mg110_2433 [Pirellulaceae bacterium]